jgi:molybdopterin-guanine dinucleotide biosynthesis protein A
VQEVTAFIIAGGKSSRMGKDKAFLEIKGKMLIDHAILQAHSVADDIFIVGPKEKFGAFGRIVTDIYPDCGPLGGIHAGLNRSRTNLSLMLALDTPFITPDFFKFLVSEAKSSNAAVTVPRTKDGLQPLCAVYSHDFFEIAQNALEAGEYKIDPLFSKAKTLIIDLSRQDLSDPGTYPQFDVAMFHNINSPEDAARAERTESAKSQSAKRP